MFISRDHGHDDLMADLIVTWIDSTNLWDAWLDGLRGTPIVYMQGVGSTLLKDGCYCPLGVLCSVAGINPEFNPAAGGCGSFVGHFGSLPSALSEFINITQYSEFKHAVPAGDFMTGKEFPAVSILALNDRARWSFPQMATYLKDHRSNMRPYGDHLIR